MSDYEESSSSEEEYHPPPRRTCKEKITITFEVFETKYIDGSGDTRERCRKCGDNPKRYYKILLAGGGDCIFCRECVGGGIARDYRHYDYY